MSVSSGTISLFASVGLAIGAAFAGAFALKNPDVVRTAVKTYLPNASAELDRMAKSGRSPEPQLSPAAAPASTYGDVTLQASGNGHFEADAEINGRSVTVLVDTGATLVALSYEDAETAGIYLRPSDFTHQVSTANGVARVAPVQIEKISIGDITVRNVRGAVGERGAMQQTLLGMTFLSQLSRVEMRDGTLVLHE